MCKILQSYYNEHNVSSIASLTIEMQIPYLWGTFFLKKLIVAYLVNNFPNLWNPKFEFRFQENISLVAILSQMSPEKSFNTISFKIYSALFSSAHRSLKWSLSFRNSNLICGCISYISHACYMSRPSHPS